MKIFEGKELSGFLENKVLVDKHEEIEVGTEGTDLPGKFGSHDDT